MSGEVGVEPGDGGFELGLEGELPLGRARDAGREQRLLLGLRQANSVIHKPRSSVHGRALSGGQRGFAAIARRRVG